MGRASSSASTRQGELAALLQAKRALLEGVRGHVRNAREGAEREALGESADHDVQPRDDLDLAIAHLQSEMLARVDAALRRFAEGRYGDCAECGGPIPIQRLHVLPFAIRCRPCEAARETSQAGPLAPPRRLFGHDPAP